MTEHTEPASKEEYERLYMTNHQITGHGVAGVTNHFPCPFCAAPEWHVVRVIDLAVPEVEGSYHTDPIRCEACGRSAKYVSSRGGGGVSMTIVQSDGPDPPEWVPIPREAATA